VHGFHVEHLTPHLWPRTADDLESLARDGSLHYAERKNEIVGACYVKDSDDADVAEFGGVCVRGDTRGACEGVSLAYALSATAIALYVAANVPGVTSKLVAHVHSKNKAPRKLLERLGFKPSRSVIIPPEHVPPNMERESDGTVIGDELEFDYSCLAAIADWLEADLPKGSFEFDCGELSWPDLLIAIREIADGYRRKPA
jgi:N-acetylglutamate synthase-like GNAT family acetyltransferase